MTMTIEMINEYGTPAVSVKIDDRNVVLEAEEVDAVIERLGLIRAAMRPEIPKEPSRASVRDRDGPMLALREASAL